LQREQRGTGDAVAAARNALGAVAGSVLVLFGDAPFVTAATMSRLVSRREQSDRPAVVVLGVRPEDPTGYGRLITDANGNLNRIVEHRDTTAEERGVRLCNSGVMAIDGKLLWQLIDAIGTENAKGEYYLTDIITIAQGLGRTVAVVEAAADELKLI